MPPLWTRLPIAFAAWLAPRRDRAAWKKEWLDEMEHRAETGAPDMELLRRAAGSFRDALFVRRQNRYSSVREFLTQPFRAEAVLLLIGGALWLATGAYRQPAPPFPNADRVVIFERSIGSLGIRAPMVTAALVDRAREIDDFESVAAFRFVRATVFGAFVSSNFFDILGAQPALGRGFRDDDPATVLLITDNYWRDRFNADPAAIGSSIEVQYRDYEIIGVMPPGFRFLSTGLKFFAPVPSGWRRVGGMGLLKPGASLGDVQAHMREVAHEVEPSWKTKSFRLRPFVHAPNRQEAILALCLGLVAFAAGAVFLLWKGIRLWKCHLLLATRLALVLVALTAGDAAIARSMLSYFRALAVIHTWVFLAVCTAAVILVVRDHLNRCPVCMKRLEHPASLGTWASMVVDPPATEYACPSGHGLMLVQETGKSRTRWTKLDESWKDLFT